jgi:plastocyanin
MQKALLIVSAFVGHCCAATLEASVADPAGAPVADAVVYAVPASGGSEVRGRKVVAVEQVDREFVPHVTVIQTGTSVTFPNRDPILHHVYSFSTAKNFEIKLYSGKSPGEFVFDKSGIVTLGCNIHDWMIGYIAVVPTPYFGKTGADGTVVLRDVPTGSYDVRVWHPQQKTPAANQAISVESNSRASFALEVVPRKPKYKPPLDRMKY